MSSWWRSLGDNVSRTRRSVLHGAPQSRDPNSHAPRISSAPRRKRAARWAASGARSCELPPPSVLPDFLANQAGDARLLLGHRDHPALGPPVGDFEQQLGPDRLLELFAVLDRHHEGTGAS